MSISNIQIGFKLRHTSWLWALVIFALPLIMLPGFPERFEFPKAILLTIMGLLSWATVMAHFSTKGLSNYWNSRLPSQRTMLVLLLVFSVWSLLSNLIASEHPLVSLFGQSYRFQGQVLFLSMAGLMAFYVLAEQRKSRFHVLLIKAVCLSGLMAVLSLLLQTVLNFWSASTLLPTYYGRMNGSFGNPNFAGAFVALTWIWWKVGFPGQSRWWILPLWIVATLVTQSRGAIVALALSVILDLGWGFFRNRKVPKYSNWVFAGGVICMLGIIVSLFLVRPIAQSEARDRIWLKAVDAIAEKPLFGWGYEQFRIPFQASIRHDDPIRFLIVDKAHNEWLEMGVATGIPGLLVYFGIWVCAAITLWQLRRSANSQTALICLVASVVLYGTNVVSVPTHFILFLVLGIALGEAFLLTEHKTSVD